jgi:hypothetical protein
VKKLIALTLLVSCTQQEMGGNTERNFHLMLPNGSYVVCEDTWEGRTVVTIENCVPAVGPWELSGEISCSHGVCWKRK